MRKILVATHGHYADGIRSSISILTGMQDNITFINAYVDDTDFIKELEEFFADVGGEDEVIAFTDLYGGSVNQKVLEYGANKNVFIISGFNLPIILETLFYTEKMTKEAMLNLVQQNREAMKMVELTDKSCDDRESFFN